MRHRNFRLEHFRAMQEISAQRLGQLREHVKAGGRFVVDLGCGDGAFSAALSRSRQQWVLGIEPQTDTILFESGSMGLAGYQKEEKFIALNRWYEQLLAGWEREFSWLEGGASQVFMIMPHPHRSFREEVELWGKMGAPRSELHVLTEDGGLSSKLRFPRPVQLIPFEPAAWQYPSTFARSYLGKSYDPLLGFGYRRMD